MSSFDPTWETLTSGYLVQICAIASLTCNCVSENPLVSIRVLARDVVETENVLVLLGTCGLASRRPLKTKECRIMTVARSISETYVERVWSNKEKI